MATKIKKISELKPYQIRFIVKQFACCEKPHIIQQQVGEVYNMYIHLDLLLTMNPIIPEICVLGEEWINLFFETRQQLFGLVKEIPVSSKFQRFEILQRLLEDFDEKNNIPMVLRVLEMARLESDPVYLQLVELLKMGEAGGYKAAGPYEA